MFSFFWLVLFLLVNSFGLLRFGGLLTLESLRLTLVSSGISPCLPSSNFFFGFLLLLRRQSSPLTPKVAPTASVLLIFAYSSWICSADHGQYCRRKTKWEI
ncbi:hypothetical protein CPB85DRAFT_1335703 [Mucidula mucida]|nr:hypothetical protein CPB85DRAFT_1335703 [Mucidula mucida]